MRWYVDISSIGQDLPAERHCVEAEQWQKALASVRANRGDDSPFGNFSIELLDDGYRAIDPLSRKRYVVQKAPATADLTAGAAAPPPAIETSVPEAPKTEKAAVRPSRPRPSARGARATGNNAATPATPPARTSDRGRTRAKAPSIPDDHVPAAATREPTLLSADAKPASVPAAPPRPSQPAAPATAGPLANVPPARPMQAETAFERMTGGSAVPLPSQVSATADVPTEVLPAFRVLSRRNEDPTPASPLTYREMAIAVAETTSLRDAEAIARAQYEVVRNSVAGAPKGKFIQLAVFDHEFTGKPKKPPLVTLAFKDWRDAEPVLAFPLRDGVVTRRSVPPSSASAAPPPASFVPASFPPVSAAAPSAPAPAPVAPSAPPASVAPATTPSAPPQAPVSAPPPAPAVIAPQPAPISAVPAPSAPAPSSNWPSTSSAWPVVSPPSGADGSEASDVIKPSPVIAITDEPMLVRPSPAVQQGPTLLEPKVQPASAPPPEPAVPAPTPSQLQTEAAAMAGDDERTVVKDSAPPMSTPGPALLAPPPAPSAEELSDADIVVTADPVVPVVTQRIASVPPPPPPRQASQPPRTATSDPPPQVRPIPAPNHTERMVAVPAAASPSAPPPPDPGAAAREPQVFQSAPPPAMAQASLTGPPEPQVFPSAPPAPQAFPSVAPAPAAQAPSVRPASIPPPGGGPPPGVTHKSGKRPRKSGDDLITDLFEACSDLGFVNDALEGADFVIDLVFDSIPSRAVLVSFFDINAREFVVVRQAIGGDALGSAVLSRTSERTSLVARSMRAARAQVVSAGAADAVEGDGRFQALGLAPESLVCAPVLAGGRYLGLIEVADPLDGRPFTDSDGHALTYIGEQFAEFLAQREVLLDPERVRRPRLSQLARR